MRLQKLFIVFFFLTSFQAFSQKTFYDLKATTIQKKDIPFHTFKGKTLLIVNIASQCGYTPQLKGLENLQKNYQDKNFEVLAFPSNDFKQEPLNGEKIGDFCKFNYGVSFKIFQKSNVTGADKHPVFKFLTPKQDIKWNFEKFLVDSHGKLYKRYPSSTKPQDINQDIQKILTKTTSH